MEDVCGVVRALPLHFLARYDDGTSDEALLTPADALSTERGFFRHRGGRVFDEIICPDTPELEYAWVWTSTFDEPVLGIR